MARGGKREGAGRKPGAVTRKTREVADKLIPEGITPLEFMLGILRDATKPEAMRFEAAKQAAPYMHAKLSAIQADHSSSDGSMTPGPTVIEFVSADAGDD